MTASILRLSGVSAGYGPVRVLHDLNLEVSPGERREVHERGVRAVDLERHGAAPVEAAVLRRAGV